MCNRIAPLFALLLLVLGGCQAQTPRETFNDVQDVYIAAVDQVIDLRVAGEIDDAAYNNVVLPAIVAGDEILDRYLIHVTTAEAEGTPVNEVFVNSLIADLRAVIQRLTPFFTKG